jgi:hypothetical protein
LGAERLQTGSKDGMHSDSERLICSLYVPTLREQSQSLAAISLSLV